MELVASDKKGLMVLKNYHSSRAGDTGSVEMQGGVYSILPLDTKLWRIKALLSMGETYVSQRRSVSLKQSKLLLSQANN